MIFLRAGLNFFPNEGERFVWLEQSWINGSEFQNGKARGPMSKNRIPVGTQKLSGLKRREFVPKNISPDTRIDNLKLRCITNNFPDVRLASLASWREANAIFLRDRGGPYIVTQKGCDPEDLTRTTDEFVLSRSGQWLSLGLFFGMSIAERWKGFVFATAGEVLRLMCELPPGAVVWRPALHAVEAVASIETDEMAAAYHFSKKDLYRAAE
jgi:hypothetical protein